MLSVVRKRAVWLTAVLLFVAASGCSPEKQGQDSFPTSSTADSPEAGTIPASEEEEPSLVFLLPSSNVYKETEDPSVIARVIQRLQAEPRCPLQETPPPAGVLRLAGIFANYGRVSDGRKPWRGTADISDYSRSTGRPSGPIRLPGNAGTAARPYLGAHHARSKRRRHPDGAENRSGFGTHNQ